MEKQADVQVALLMFCLFSCAHNMGVPARSIIFRLIVLLHLLSLANRSDNLMIDALLPMQLCARKPKVKLGRRAGQYFQHVLFESKRGVRSWEQQSSFRHQQASCPTISNPHRLQRMYKQSLQLSISRHGSRGQASLIFNSLLVAMWSHHTILHVHSERKYIACI